MTTTNRRRRALVSTRRSVSRGESIFKKLCLEISRRRFIPIIGDTIRISHIFDVDLDDDLGIDNEEYNSNEDLTIDEEDRERYLKLNVIEELAYDWAGSIGYPLSDRYRISRVAQFQALKERNTTEAKKDYLSYLKDYLLDVAEEVAIKEADQEGLELVSHLRREPTRSFANIVRELDFPRFGDDQQDPLRLLARLPLKIYVTTSYHNFIEQALIVEGKNPHSRLCFWNMDPDGVLPQHRIDEAYEPDVANPVVYHLLGMEQYPASLVLTEDDYLDFIWKMAEDLPGIAHSAERIIPPYLAAELKLSSLLLLGYRLQDWDFRVLFRGLIKSIPDRNNTAQISVALQIDLNEQPLVEDEEQANLYLQRFFDEANFRVQFGNSDEFVYQLWETWQRLNRGGTL